MTKLERLRVVAQQAADRDGKPKVILNLNRYSPLYVVRDAIEGEVRKPESVVVERFEPMGVQP